jgi:putative phosphoribosyl transferase
VSQSPEPGTPQGELTVTANGQSLEGNLTLPPEAVGLVLFAHGSGSSRSSPRSRLVAQALHEVALGTLLFDLLTPAESRSRANVFDIPLLAERLHGAARWCREQPGLAALPQGYFGASTGAAAALRAAANDPAIQAIVSRGGRPDLAEAYLAKVAAPTLLIVGREDTQVLEWNEAALARLDCVKSMVVIPGATHLFEEPGTLEEVARHAAGWFTKYLPAR